MFLITYLFRAGLKTAWSGRVRKIITGDTIQVFRWGEPVTIRLYGIAAPKMAQYFGTYSKIFMEGIAKPGDLVDVQELGKDRFGRVIGLVHPHSSLRTFNGGAVECGYAWVCRRYCDRALREKWLKYEAHAKKAGLGLFYEKEPVHPALWKLEHRNNGFAKEA